MRLSRRVWGRVAAGFLATGMGTVVAQPPAGDPPKAVRPQEEGGKADEKAPKADGKGATDTSPPPSILKPGEYPIDLGTALRLAGEANPQLLLARARLSQVVAKRQLATA